MGTFRTKTLHPTRSLLPGPARATPQEPSRPLCPPGGAPDGGRGGHRLTAPKNDQRKAARDKTREMSLRVAAINYRGTRQKKESKKFLGKGWEKTMGMKLKNGYTNY
jgi:hypothetical protein